MSLDEYKKKKQLMVYTVHRALEKLLSVRMGPNLSTYESLGQSIFPKTQFPYM